MGSALATFYSIIHSIILTPIRIGAILGPIDFKFSKLVQSPFIQVVAVRGKLDR